MANGNKIYTTQEAQNTALGQIGSVFISDTSACTPASNTTFVAITIVEDCTFATSGGLVPENGVAVNFLSTTTKSNSSATGGNAITDATTFSAGTTLYGRWSQIQLASAGAVIAYIG